MNIFNDEEFRRMMHDDKDQLWDMVINSINEFCPLLKKLDDLSDVEDPPDSEEIKGQNSNENIDGTSHDVHRLIKKKRRNGEPREEEPG